MNRGLTAILCFLLSGICPFISADESSNVQFSGRYGGTCWNLFADNDRLYIGEGASVRILSLPAEGAPESLGVAFLPDTATAIHASGDFAVATVGTSGLRTLNVADPASPLIAGACALTGFSQDLAVSGNFAFVAAGSGGLRVVNILDPAAPAEVGFFLLEGQNALGLDHASGLVFLAETGGLRIVDVSTPSAPAQRSFWAADAPIIDVHVSGNYAYLAASANGLVVLNISNPAAPQKTGELYTDGMWISDVAVSGNTACLTDSVQGQVLVVDVGAPATPVLKGTLPFANAMTVQSRPGFAFAAARNGGVRIIDTSNPEASVQKSEFVSCGSAGGVAWCPSYATCGDGVYAAMGDTGLHALSIQDPANPRIMSRVDTPGSAKAAFLKDGLIHLADHNRGLRIVNWISGETVGALETGFSSARHLIVDGNYAYVSDRERGLKIIDITDKTKPGQVYEYLVASSMYACDVKEGRAYAAHGDSGLRVLDVANPAAPVELGFFRTAGSVRDVAVNDGKAYLADAQGGLRILDVSDPAAIIEIGQAATPQNALGIALSGRYALVAAGTAGLRVFDVSNPAAPVEKGYYDPPGNAEYVTAGRGNIFLSCGDAGLYFLRLSPALSFTPALCVLTAYDVWVAESQGVPPFSNPLRKGWIKFQYNPAEQFHPYAGDVDGDGIPDLIQTTPYGDAWVSLNVVSEFQTPTRWGWLGFRYDERDGYAGNYPLTGDFNGDGRKDMGLVTQYHDVWVSLSSGTSFGAPTRWGWLGFSFNRAIAGEPGALPLAGDFNGDGKTDIAQVTQYGDVWVALSTGSGFSAPTRWAWLGFRYAPYQGLLPLTGDFNGDGISDIVQITASGDPWVALSTGSGFAAPTRWAWLGFIYNEDTRHYPMAADVNSDLKCDLIQITPTGDPWVALSTGSGFQASARWGWLGFTWNRTGYALPLFLGIDPSR